MSADAAVPPSPARPTPSLFEIFVAFAAIALYGFGGVLAWSRRMVVDEREWMTPEEFNEAYAVCQFLPGPNVVNFSVVFGSRFRGPLGAAVALAGLMGPPMLIVLAIGALYTRYGDIAALQRAFGGMTAAAAGLVIGIVAKMAQPLLRERVGLAPAIAVLVFVAVGVLRWPIYWVLPVLVPVSIAVAWWVRR
jgi:chromate transporter